MNNKIRVMVAGIGGASLGTEILKCLLSAKRYTVFGCDISPLAYGHYQEGFNKTFVISRDSYIDSVLEACRKARCDCIVPGGEEPMILLAGAKAFFEAESIRVAINSPELITLCSNKATCFEALAELGFKIPVTKAVTQLSDLDDMPLPCIIKPATGSGGSVFTFLAKERQEAILYMRYLICNGKAPLLQEHISHDEGEYTVGVLSLPNGRIACSVALRRLFDSKLSVLFRGETGLISSGYSQGIIEDFPECRRTAEAIALALQSVGPINVQGRLRDGVFFPFEINPRFSASTYLRALAGINEVDFYLRSLFHHAVEFPIAPRPGLYLRSLSEAYVPMDLVKS